jgi:hypothetical protein
VITYSREEDNAAWRAFASLTAAAEMIRIAHQASRPHEELADVADAVAESDASLARACDVLLDQYALRWRRRDLVAAEAVELEDEA